MNFRLFWGEDKPHSSLRKNEVCLQSVPPDMWLDHFFDFYFFNDLGIFGS